MDIFIGLLVGVMLVLKVVNALIKLPLTFYKVTIKNCPDFGLRRTTLEFSNSIVQSLSKFQIFYL